MHTRIARLLPAAGLAPRTLKKARLLHYGYSPVFSDSIHVLISTEVLFTDTGLWGAAFLLYSMLVISAIVYLIWYVAPVHGNSSIFVYLGICSLIGSLSVMSVKARPRPCHRCAWDGKPVQLQAHTAQEGLKTCPFAGKDLAHRCTSQAHHLGVLSDEQRVTDE